MDGRTEDSRALMPLLRCFGDQTKLNRKPKKREWDEIAEYLYILGLSLRSLKSVQIAPH